MILADETRYTHEPVLLTETLARQAAAAALEGAKTHGHNDYKRELAQRVIVRALLEAKSMSLNAPGSPS